MNSSATTPAPSAMTADLIDALQRLCTHEKRTSAQIDADWDYARSVLARASQPVAAAPVAQAATDEYRIDEQQAHAEMYAMETEAVSKMPRKELVAAYIAARAALQQRQAPAQADLLGEVIGEVKELTCAPHPVGYTAKEARMFNLGFYAGTSLAVEKIAERKALAQQAEATPICGWKDCPHGAECVHAKAEAAPVAKITEPSQEWCLRMAALEDGHGDAPPPVGLAAPGASAEPIYQVQFAGMKTTWHDVAVGEWGTFADDRRRIVYGVAQATPAPTAEPVGYIDPISAHNLRAGRSTKEWMWARKDSPGAVPVYFGASPSPHPVSIGAGADHFVVMQEFLNWNRAQPTPPVAIAKEYAVARKVLELAAHPSPEGGAAEAKGGVA